jgi:hypothetical protein
MQLIKPEFETKYTVWAKEVFRNKQVLLKTLYTVSPNNIIEIFSKDSAD